MNMQRAAIGAIGAVLLATAGGCKPMPLVSTVDQPRTFAIEKTSELPEDLQAGSAPVVVILLRQADEDRTREVADAMHAKGYLYEGRRDLEFGIAELRFLGDLVQVVETPLEVVGWTSSRVLWSAGIPFDWSFSMYYGMFVPQAHAARARALLARDPIAASCLIDADGELHRDKIGR